MTLAQQRFLVQLVLSNDELFWNLGFCVAGVGVRRLGPRSGSHDVKGFSVAAA